MGKGEGGAGEEFSAERSQHLSEPAQVTTTILVDALTGREKKLVHQNE